MSIFLKNTSQRPSLSKDTFQGNAFDYYKRNYYEAQKFIDNTGFQNVQGISANIANRFSPSHTEETDTLKNTNNTKEQGIKNMATKSNFSFTSPSFLKGVLLGAGVAFIATNPTVQKKVVNGAVSLFTFLQGSIEEVKEQIQDAKEELSQEKE